MSVEAVDLPAVQARALLFHGPGFDPAPLQPALRQEGVLTHPAPTIAHVGWVGETPAVLLVDDGHVSGPRDFDTELATLPGTVVLVATSPAVAARIPGERVLLSLTGVDADADLRVLRSGYQLSAARVALERSRRELQRTRTELAELHRIGMGLMTERTAGVLLEQILEQAKALTSSDAGSLYLVDSADDGATRLRFKLARYDSLQNLPAAEYTLPINEGSLAGYAAVTRRPLVLEDAYRLPPGAPYSFNRSFDERFGYRTKSVLVMPMVDHGGQLVGVLQLLNSKSDPYAVVNSEAAADEYVLSYGEHELHLVESFAGHAAAAIQNAQLYARMQGMFESFVKAAVTAVDQRDPSTAGHSIRVAALTVDLARALEREESGPYAGTRFTPAQLRELRFAALLHDFGKVGVREEVLSKARKLPPHLYERVEARFDLIRRTIESDYFRRRGDVLRAGGSAAMLQELEQSFARELRELDQFQEAVHAANEPVELPHATGAVLGEMALRRFRTPVGEDAPYLTPEEIHYLSIPRGTLDEHERLEIQCSVEQTYRLLTQIPWTAELRNVPGIAYRHRENLNGTGYPQGVTGGDIPLQTRLITIADIFDALTASDRPYRRAFAVDHALEILRSLAAEGRIDEELVRILAVRRVYRRVLEQDWRTF